MTQRLRAENQVNRTRPVNLGTAFTQLAVEVEPPKESSKIEEEKKAEGDEAKG
jgi:hypothetical protein